MEDEVNDKEIVSLVNIVIEVVCIVATTRAVVAKYYHDTQIVRRLCRFNQSHRGGDRSKNVYWTLAMDYCLCNLLIDQIHQGGRVDEKFTTNAWKKVVEDFNTSQMTNLNRGNFKSRMKTWRKTYSALSEISNKSGFGWNSIAQCFTGEVDAMDAFYEKHHQLAPYKNKKFPLYEKCLIIFGKDVATSGGAIAGDDKYKDTIGSSVPHTPGSNGHRTPALSDGEDMLDSHPIDLNEDEEFENIDSGAFVDELRSTPYGLSRVRPSSDVIESQRSKRRKHGTWEHMANIMESMTNVIEKLGSHVGTMSSKYKSKGKVDEERTNRVCKYVSEIPDILPELIYPTFIYIIADDTRASKFLGLEPHIRPSWFQDHLFEIIENALSFTTSPFSSTTSVVSQSSSSAPFAAPTVVPFVVPSTRTTPPFTTTSFGMNPHIN